MKLRRIFAGIKSQGRELPRAGHVQNFAYLRARGPVFCHHQFILIEPNTRYKPFKYSSRPAACCSAGLARLTGTSLAR